jgi:hypothetical protein
MINSSYSIFHPSEFNTPYFQNQSCDPFTPRETPCTLGNYASYSINVTGVDDVQAGLKFVTDNNIRLTIKNTGHEQVITLIEFVRIRMC